MSPYSTLLRTVCVGTALASVPEERVTFAEIEAKFDCQVLVVLTVGFHNVLNNTAQIFAELKVL